MSGNTGLKKALQSQRSGIAQGGIFDCSFIYILEYAAIYVGLFVPLSWRSFCPLWKKKKNHYLHLLFKFLEAAKNTLENKLGRKIKRKKKIFHERFSSCEI